MRAQFRPLGAHLLKAQGCPEMPSMHDKPVLTCDRFLLKAVTEQLMPQDLSIPQLIVHRGLHEDFPSHPVRFVTGASEPRGGVERICEHKCSVR